MSELKPCPICGATLKIYSPEDWKPTFYDPDSGGDPYNAVCDCGFQYSSGSYDYAEFVAALNRRAQPENEPLTLDELRGMKESKDPVWMGRSKQWIFVASVADAPYAQVWYFTAKGMADTVLYHHEAFYRRKPERSEG